MLVVADPGALLHEGHRAAQLFAVSTAAEQPVHQTSIENDAFNGKAMLMSRY
jgi:hypothetical protein